MPGDLNSSAVGGKTTLKEVSSMLMPLELIVQRLVQSGLLTEQQVYEYMEKLPVKGRPQSGEQLLGILVRDGRLTRYQKDRLREDDFHHLVLSNGDYVVQKLLGSGTFGDVFLAKHRRLMCRRVLKILKRDWVRDPVTRDRFRREMYASARLQHENIVLIHDAREDKGMMFLVLEYLKDGDLGKWLNSHASPTIADGLRMIRDAALGLDHAHQQGLVHRDVKPENLLLDRDGRIKISDFGLVGLLDDATLELPHLTRTGTGMGTRAYMAPEQGRDAKSVDGRADVYSLGVVLFRLLTGRLPFLQNQDLEAMWRQPIPSLVDACSAATARVDKLFARMVAKRREDRFDTMAEVVAALDECLRESELPIVAAPFTSTFLLPATPKNMETQSPAEGEILQEAASPDFAILRPGQVAAERCGSNPVLPKRSSTTLVCVQMGCPKFVSIPDGEFHLGSPQTEIGRSSNEGPQRCVRISRPFWLSVTPVTQEEFFSLLGRNPSYFAPTGGGAARIQGLEPERFPVEMVTWFDVLEFANALSQAEELLPFYLLESLERDADGCVRSALVKCLGGNGYRLPTEAEWEYACRAGSTMPFHFGNMANGVQANFDGNEPYGIDEPGPFLNRPHTVGTYPANGFGLYDMHGNVWEWCDDGFASDAYARLTLDVAVDPWEKTMPHGTRVLRGGSWFSDARSCRAATRGSRCPNDRDNYIGFRLARTPIADEAH